jgi:hypothetical protein
MLNNPSCFPHLSCASVSFISSRATWPTYNYLGLVNLRKPAITSQQLFSTTRVQRNYRINTDRKRLTVVHGFKSASKISVDSFVPASLAAVVWRSSWRALWLQALLSFISAIALLCAVSLQRLPPTLTSASTIPVSMTIQTATVTIPSVVYWMCSSGAMATAMSLMLGMVVPSSLAHIFMLLIIIQLHSFMVFSWNRCICSGPGATRELQSSCELW